MFILRWTDYSFTITFLLVLRCYLSGRYGILRPAFEPSVAPACAVLGSTTRAADVGAGFRIILENPSRALAARDVESAHASHRMAASEIEDSSCDAQLAAAGTSLGMGMSFGAVLASGRPPQGGRRYASRLLPMGNPVQQGDHFQAVLRSEQLQHLEGRFRASCVRSTMA